jgi:transaldolase
VRIFLDTANFDEIRDAHRMGVLAGVTTNPSLVAKEAGSGEERTYRDRVVEICDLVQGPVSAECTSRDVPDLLAEARDIASWHKHVVVKIPMDANGLEATSILSKEGIRINMTLVFSPNQALLAALAGATYVSPFVGRLDDAGHDGMEVVRQSVEIFDNYHLPTQVLAASIRTAPHVVQAALAGAHIATLPYNVLQQMIRHPLTDLGIERFLADSRKYASV